MTTSAAMSLMRAAARLLVSRGLCGKWIPGVPVLCAIPAGHPLPCTYYQQIRGAA